MRAWWRVRGLNSILVEAWRAGVVLAGLSGGAICWLEAGVTDSFGASLGPLGERVGAGAGTRSRRRRATWGRRGPGAGAGIPGCHRPDRVRTIEHGAHAAARRHGRAPAPRHGAGRPVGPRRHGEDAARRP